MRGVLLGVVLACGTTPLCGAAGESVVVVTGASGRTGALLYRLLRSGAFPGNRTRALVRNVTQARERLGCDACDIKEGIYLGDVTKPDTLAAAFDGADTLAIAVGVSGSGPRSEAEAVEFTGVKNQVRTLLRSGAAHEKRVLLISTMGTTSPPESGSNDVFFYKLNAEAFLLSAGVPCAIVKPCGLSLDGGGQRELMAGHDDGEDWFQKGWYLVPRADVAAVAAAALVQPAASTTRFDLCAKGAGSGPPDVGRVLREALLPWQRDAAQGWPPEPLAV